MRTKTEHRLTFCGFRASAVLHFAKLAGASIVERLRERGKA